jgi:hypothetical protein
MTSKASAPASTTVGDFTTAKDVAELAERLIREQQVPRDTVHEVIRLIFEKIKNDEDHNGEQRVPR